MVSSFRPSPTSLAPWEQAPSSSDFGATSVAHPPPGPALGGASVSDFFSNGFGSAGRTGHPLRPLAAEVFAAEAAAEEQRGHMIAAQLAIASSSSRTPSENSASSNDFDAMNDVVSSVIFANAVAPDVEASKDFNSDRDTSSEGESDERAPLGMQDAPAAASFLGAADFLGSEPRSPDLIVSPGPQLAEQEAEAEPERLGPEQPPEVLWMEIMRQREEIRELQVQLKKKDEELRHCRTGTKISATTSNFLI